MATCQTVPSFAAMNPCKRPLSHAGATKTRRYEDARRRFLQDFAAGAGPQDRHVEVDQQARVSAGYAHVIDRLRMVNRRQMFDRLDLDDQYVGDKEIEIDIAEVLAAIRKREPFFSFEPNLRGVQLQP